MNKRVFFLLATIVLIMLEVLIALFVHDNFVRPYLGDVIVVVVVYCFVRIFIPEKVYLLPLYVFLFAVMVEVLQYFHIVDLLGLGNSTFFRILIGGVFDWKDILCYGVGCLLLGAFELFRFRRAHEKEK